MPPSRGRLTLRVSALLGAHARRDAALAGGFQRALLACAIVLLAAAVIALRASSTRGEPTAYPGPAGHDRMPAPGLTG